MFQTVLLLFGVFFGRPAWCARPDAISSSTAIGSGYFMESVLVHKHFAVIQGDEESVFSRNRDSADEEPDELHSRSAVKKKVIPFQPSSLSWELGYAYANPTAAAQQPNTVLVPVGSLASQSIVGGLDWEALDVLDMSLGLELDTLPNLDYRHGRITIRIEYFKPVGLTSTRKAILDKLRDDQYEGDDRDARVYYLNHSTTPARTAVTTRYLGGYRKKGAAAARTDYSDDDDDDPESIASLRAQLQSTYPNLKAALVFNFDDHLLQSPVTQTLKQFEFGPDVNLDLNADTRFHLSGLFSGYTSSVQNFVAQLPVSPGNSVVLPASSLAAFQPRFLAFPTFVFEEGVSRDFSRAWTGEFYVNQVFYAEAGIGVSVGLAPMLLCSISSHWRLGAGADLVLGGPGTTALGLLNLSYLF